MRENPIHQMLSAMIPNAQNTTNQILKVPKNAKPRHMPVLVMQITLRLLLGLMMVDHA